MDEPKATDNLQVIREIRHSDRDRGKFWVVVLGGNAVLPAAVHLGDVDCQTGGLDKEVRISTEAL